MYKWDRALEIAITQKTHVDTVIAYRRRFLEQYQKQETIPRYKELGAEIDVDWETVKTKIKAEKEREAQANQWKKDITDMITRSHIRASGHNELS